MRGVRRNDGRLRRRRRAALASGHQTGKEGTDIKGAASRIAARHQARRRRITTLYAARLRRLRGRHVGRCCARRWQATPLSRGGARRRGASDGFALHGAHLGVCCGGTRCTPLPATISGVGLLPAARVKTAHLYPLRHFAATATLTAAYNRGIILRCLRGYNQRWQQRWRAHLRGYLRAVAERAAWFAPAVAAAGERQHQTSFF